MRLQTMQLINIHLKRAKQYKDPTAFMRFPWEKDELTDDMIDDLANTDWEELNERYKDV